jgi:hypothetical protein
MLVPNQKLVSSALLSSAIAACVVGGGLKAVAQDAKQQIGPDALWGPGMSEMQMIQQNCASAGTQFRECFANGMQKSGASPQAVAFTNMTGNTGYMRDFRQTGRVSIAYVYFPFRANENQGAYLVNGTPSMIDIDNQSLLAQNQLAKNPTYTQLAKKYPEITLFPGDRDGTSYLVAGKLSSGGQRFIVPYNLQNQCHACEQVGIAKFAFDFDRTGKFLGTKLLGVTADVAATGAEKTAQTTPAKTTPPASTYRPGPWQPVTRINPQNPVTVTLINNTGVNLKYNLLDDKGEVDLPAGSSKQLSRFSLPANIAIYNPAAAGNVVRTEGLNFTPSATNNDLQITIQSVSNGDDGVVNISPSGAIYVY